MTPPTRKLVTRLALLVTLILPITLVAGPGSPAGSQGNSRTFPETGQTVQGRFLTYWESNGGLAQQGYPISAEMQERSDTDGNVYKVQYFERAVFELHPENQPPYDVLLSLLGTFEYKQRYPNGAPNQQASTTNARLFPQTGKTLGGRFRQYWEQNGGLAQQGYPLTDEFEEVSSLNGQRYKVQYFERAVFELHPENQPPFDVLLSQLGTFRYRAKYEAPDWAPKQLGRLSANSWSWDSSMPVAVTVNGDGKDVVAVLYRYPGEKSALFAFDLSRGELTPRKVWESLGLLDWERAKLFAADLNGDGIDQPIIFYDDGSNTTMLYSFTIHQEEARQARPIWGSGDGNWAWVRTLPVAGDFNGDGNDEIGAFYNYLNNTTGLFTFDFSSGRVELKRVWTSGEGAWGWDRTKPLSGDFDGDGKDEIVAFYNYPNNNTGLFRFDLSSGEVVLQRLWSSGEGAWSWDNTWPLAADFNGDGKDDIAVLYQYPSNRVALFTFTLNNGETTTEKVWESENGWASLANAKPIAGDLDGDGKASIVMMYKHNADTVFWQFK